ncbi:MAG: glycosyltransferase, partial [Gammaproteobacteria bacterium]
MKKLSIVIPAKNEARNLEQFLPRLRDTMAAMSEEVECIVVDDGSSDDTADICRANDVEVISHPYSKGNGAAIKTGARAAS